MRFVQEREETLALRLQSRFSYGEQPLGYQAKDEAHLTFSHIVFGLRFDQSMAHQESDLFLGQFLAHLLNKTIREVFHDDWLQGESITSALNKRAPEQTIQRFQQGSS